MGVMQHFSTTLESLRKEKGLTQKQLADELGVSRGTISFYEKAERTADIEFLVKASEYFNVSVNYLLGKARARSVNTSVDDICEYTGLNEKAVEFLNHYIRAVSNLKEKAKEHGNPFFDNELQYAKTKIDLINDILNSDDFHFALDNLSTYIVKGKKYADEISCLLNDEAYMLGDDLLIRELYLNNAKIKYYDAKDNLQEMVANICEPILCESTGLNIDISARRIKESIIDMVISLDEKECEADANHNEEE